MEPKSNSCFLKVWISIDLDCFTKVSCNKYHIYGWYIRWNDKITHASPASILWSIFFLYFVFFLFLLLKYGNLVQASSNCNTTLCWIRVYVKCLKKRKNHTNWNKTQINCLQSQTIQCLFYIKTKSTSLWNDGIRSCSLKVLHMHKNKIIRPILSSKCELYNKEKNEIKFQGSFTKICISFIAKCKKVQDKFKRMKNFLRFSEIVRE